MNSKTIVFVAGVVTGSVIPLLVDNYQLYKRGKDLTQELNYTKQKLQRAEKELERRPPYQPRFGTPRNGKIVYKDYPDYPIGFM